jgi:hypothetical protein
MNGTLRIRLFLCVLLLVAGAAYGETALEAHMAAAAKLLDPRAQATLEQMPDLERRLLAMRGYLRSGAQFGDRWSWTQAQIDRYERSREKREAEAELERIRARFAEMNPGYTLRVNTAVRSLDIQLARWNSNRLVAKTAEQLRKDVDRELVAKHYPTLPTLGSTAQFAAFLRTWVPRSPAPLAVPGLSRHGQARAFDFHIMQGEKVIATTNVHSVKTAWDRTGWTEKLKTTVESTSDRFRGPLAAPYEPWHYEYLGGTTPVADAQDAPHERVTSHDSGS